MTEFELISAGDPPMVDVTADDKAPSDEIMELWYKKYQDNSRSIKITEPAYGQTHGDDTGDIDLDRDDSDEPTHECQSCGTGQQIDTPYSSLDAWCEPCDGVRTHTEIDE